MDTYLSHTQNNDMTFSSSTGWVPINVPLNSVSPYDTQEWGSSESDAAPLVWLEFATPHGDNVYGGGNRDQAQLHGQVYEGFHPMTPAEVSISEETVEKFLTKKTYASSNLDSNIDICAMCQAEYENKEEIGVLRCGHEFHVNCIKPWLRKRNECPMCRAHFLVLKIH